jgi:bacterioferritin (cytochrome b1)
MKLSDDELMWLLNQYRSAELRGAGVILRLGRLADTTDLRANFTRHLRDEGVHAWMWTRAILALGGEVDDVADPYQARLGALFGVPRTVEELLALTLVSERRGVATYEEHLDDAEAPEIVQRTLRAILKDERWHVSWIEGELERRSRGNAAIADIQARAEAADLEAVAAIGTAGGLL